MRALTLADFGGSDLLHVVDRPRPVLPPGRSVVVRVHASFVSPARDAQVRSGGHAFFRRLITLPHILGGEFSGIVEEVADRRDSELIGRRVAVAAGVDCERCPSCRAGRPWECSRVSIIGIQHPGSNAEFCSAPAANVVVIPDELGFAEAAVLGANGPVALEQLEVSELRTGAWVLVPGAAGAVGLLLVALAGRAGARVIALTRDGRGDDVVRSVGAEWVLDAERDDLAQAILDIAPHGVSVVLDNVAQTALWQRYFPAVAHHARVVTIGQTGVREPLALDVLAICQRRVRLSGLRSGDKRVWRRFWQEQQHRPLRLAPETLLRFDLTDGAGAHDAVERHGRTGSVVLEIP